MTRRLYYDDAYTSVFTARVVDVVPQEDGRVGVELDATFFYPTGGGQLADNGLLAGCAVSDVVDDGERILHVVEARDAPAPGSEVEARIDAVRRRHHRQQHTGQHVLSRVLEDRLGLPTVSSRLGETVNTLDLQTADISWQELDAVEDVVWDIVAEARPVRVDYLDPGEADTGDRAKARGPGGRVRVIEVADLDRCACGGTHVANTAEIGPVAIVRKERVKGGLRLHFLCGDRAHAYRRRRDRLVARLMAALSTGEEGLESAVEKLGAEARAATRRAGHIVQLWARSEALRWLDAAVPLAGGAAPARWVGRVLDAEMAEAASHAAAVLTAAADVVAGLVVCAGERTQLLLARGARIDVDCAEVLARVVTALDGRGGGRADFARGSCPRRDAEAVLGRLRQEVEAALGPTPAG